VSDPTHGGDHLESIGAGIEETVPWRPGDDAQEETLGPGQPIGRYVVQRRLGEGAMGVVYAAEDPSLERVIAIKLLRSTGEQASERLLREAQSLAKLSHPNVVTIHDVGVHETRVFLAMEFVAGRTLRDDMRRGERSWSGWVRVMSAAGTGLQAAHQAGLVHRDFKPENVMLGDDGRVRVMDFGLARAGSQERADTEAAPFDSAPLEVLGPEASQLTQAGALMGTPAYMAPEQFLGLPADARSDQFALCVTLYECIYGERPFAGSTVTALAATVTEGELRAPPAGSDVPLWLRRVLARGLSTNPADRWPDLDALLAALAADPAHRRRAWIRWGVAAAAVTGAVATTALLTSQPAACAEMERRLDGVWGADRANEIRASFAASEASFASQSADRVVARVDQWSTRWVNHRVSACRATRVTGDQSEAVMDRRMACLDRALRDLDASLSVLDSDVDVDVVRRATDVAARVPRLEPCADLERLAAKDPPPEDPQLAATVQTIGDQIARGRALERAGKYEAGLEIADAAVQRAEEAGHEATLSSARSLRGTLRQAAGQYSEAEEDLQAAYHASLTAGDAERSVFAARSLAMVVGYRQGKPEEGQTWIGHAHAHAQALDRPVERAQVQQTRGILAYVGGDYPTARREYAAALEVLEEELGTEHPAVATLVNNIAVVDDLSGDFSAARSGYLRALELRNKVDGPRHPSVAETLNNLGALAYAQQDFEEAESRYRSGLEIASEALGETHPDVAFSLTGLGSAALGKGDLEQAETLFQQALDIRERALGPDHPSAAESLNNLGAVAHERGDPSSARRHYERALAIYERVVGPRHPVVASCHAHIADALADANDRAAARERYALVVEIRTELLGPDHPDTRAAAESLASLSD
jgi:tetratricopeptide (TPR) repeat protein